MKDLNKHILQAGCPDDPVLTALKDSGIEKVDHREKYGGDWKSRGPHTYVISPINAKKKVSLSYASCTGIAVVGEKRSSKQKVSFLSHQDPSAFLEPMYKRYFVSDLSRRLDEMQNICAAESIKLRGFGGNFNHPVLLPYPEHLSGYYQDSKLLLSEIVGNVFGYELQIATGPKIVPGKDHVLLNTDASEIFIVRPKTECATDESFLAGEFETQRRKWLLV